MRLFFVVLLSLLFLVVDAQDWQTVKADSVVAYYSHDGFGNIHPIRIDSTYSHGDTTDLYSFRMFRPSLSNSSCIVVGEPWVGSKTSILPDGINIFYNHQHHPFFINTLADVNEPWVFHTFPDGSYVEANVYEQSYEKIIDIFDSIKKIELVPKDAQGNSLAGTSSDIAFVADLSLHLSKSFGLTKIIDFYSFPFSGDVVYINESMGYGNERSFDLIGLSSPQMGYQNLTAKDIFDYNVGDEFHRLGKTDPTGWCSYEHSLRKIINEIVEKDVSVNGDSITYKVDYCRSDWYKSYPNIEHYSSGQGTYTLLIELNEPYYIKYDYLPLEASTKNWPQTFSIANVNYKTFYGYNSYVFNNDSCYSILIDSEASQSDYKAGLGLVSFASGSMCGSSVSEELVYYKKGSVEYGTPFQCSVLLEINEVNSNAKFSLYPNPASEFVQINNIEVQSSFYDYAIYNTSGQMKLKGSLTNSTEIDIKSLEKGVYIIDLMSSENRQFCKLVVH